MLYIQLLGLVLNSFFWGCGLALCWFGLLFWLDTKGLHIHVIVLYSQLLCAFLIGFVWRWDNQVKKINKASMAQWNWERNNLYADDEKDRSEDHRSV